MREDVEECNEEDFKGTENSMGITFGGGRAKDFRGKCELYSRKDKVFNADNTWYSWACITLCDTHRLLAL